MMSAAERINALVADYEHRCGRSRYGADRPGRAATARLVGAAARFDDACDALHYRETKVTFRSAGPALWQLHPADHETGRQDSSLRPIGTGGLSLRGGPIVPAT